MCTWKVRFPRFYQLFVSLGYLEQLFNTHMWRSYQHVSICAFNSFNTACNIKAFFVINQNREQAACFVLLSQQKSSCLVTKWTCQKKVNVTNLNFPSNVLDFRCSPKLDVYSFATLIKVQVRVLHFQRFHTNLVFSSGVVFYFKLDTHENIFWCSRYRISHLLCIAWKVWTTLCYQCFYIGDSMAVSTKLCCRQNKRKCLSQSAICFLQAQNFPINDQANRGEYTFHKENHEGLFCAVCERTWYLRPVLVSVGCGWASVGWTDESLWVARTGRIRLCAQGARSRREIHPSCLITIIRSSLELTEAKKRNRIKSVAFLLVSADVNIVY